MAAYASVSPAGRRSKSAEVERFFFDGDWESDEDDIRPVTASGTLGTKPKSRLGRRSTRDGASKPPTDVAIEGWGDFDSDRLFKGESFPPQPTNSARMKETVAVVHEEEPPRLKREPDPQRIEELAKPTTKPPPPSQKDASKQVLRQRALAVMELSAPDNLAAGSLGRKTSQKVKAIAVHRRDKKSDAGGSDTESTRLPKIKKGAHYSPRVSGLFGPDIPDSLETRAIVFERFLSIWSLMTSRFCSTSRDTTDVKADCKSPFECSMVLTKICKTIGIVLTTSPAPDVWSPSRQRGSASDVDFQSFCDFVVRNALQPAMHHFRLDHDLSEYLHTVDTIILSLVTRVDAQEQMPAELPSGSQWRLRELSELQPVLPHWKKGIPAIQKQHPLVKMSPSAAILASDTEYIMPTEIDDASGRVAIVSANEEPSIPFTTVSVVLPGPSTGGYPIQAKKLPLNEARALQDANIRRKIQLRKSWQPRVVLGDPQIQQQDKPRTPTALQGVTDASAGHALGSCILVEAVHRTAPSDSSPRVIKDNQAAPSDSSPRVIKDNQADDEELPASHTGDTSPVLLLCGSCPGEEEATLWCSNCFAVYCSSCWTSTHHSVVDMALIDTQCGLPMPSARPMRTHRDSFAPPVHMIYLPTKPLATGRLARGIPSSKQPPLQGNQLEGDGDNPGSREDDEPPRTRLVTSLSSQAILPSIRPAARKQKAVKGLQRHRSTPTLQPMAAEPLASSMDSTANLLKALMLGTASSASVLGSTESPSSWPTSCASRGSSQSVSKRTYKEPHRRKKLLPAAVTLDAEKLLPRE